MERPASRNALGRVLLGELEEAIASVLRTCAGGAPSAAPPPAAPTRALILASSVPGVFCAGADLRERATMTPGEARAFVGSLRRAFSSLAALPVVTVACVDGLALGGGFELALACDLRVGGRGAGFALPETGLAIIPGAGGTQRLPRAVGMPRAKELVFTGRRIGAEEALAWGLLARGAPEGAALATALGLARECAAKGPLALAAAKRAMDDGADAGGLPEGMGCEGVAYEAVLASEDRLEGLAAFRDKRPPRYRGV